MRRCLLIAVALALTFPSLAQKTSGSITSIESLIRSQQYDQARAALRSALRERPSDFRLWALQGICAGLQGDDRAALAAFDHALRISPDYVPALRGEIEDLYKTGDKRAIPLLERLLRSDPNDLTAHEMLGTLEQRGGNCRQAVVQFEASKEAIANHPGSLEAYGYCLSRLGRTADAIPVFRQLIPLVPGSTYPVYDLAVLLVSTKQYQEAANVLQPFLTAGQNDADVLSLASQAYEGTGNTPKAVALQRQAIVANPSDPTNYVLFAVLSMAHDSFQVGISMLNAGIERVPDDASLYLSRGVLYAQLADYDKAETDFKRAEQLDSRQSIGAYAGDLTVLQRNDPKTALARVREQLKAHPDDPLLRLLLAQLIMNGTPDPQSAEFKEAMRNAQAAAKTRPALVEAHNQLASMYMSLEQYDRAISECRTALHYDPSNETAMYHLIISMRHSGHNADLAPLVKRLSELHQESLQHETARKRYRLVEERSAPPQPAGAQ